MSNLKDVMREAKRVFESSEMAEYRMKALRYAEYYYLRTSINLKTCKIENNFYHPSNVFEKRSESLLTEDWLQIMNEISNKGNDEGIFADIGGQKKLIR